MKNLPPELFYVLIFAAILLYQFLMKRMAPQQSQESAPDEPQLEMPEELEEIPVSSPAPKLAVGHFGRTEAPRASLRPATPRFSRQALMGNRRQVQDAIVIATILGRCRAFEPHDIP